MRGTWKLKSLHAKLAINLPEDKCSHRLCDPVRAPAEDTPE